MEKRQAPTTAPCHHLWYVREKVCVQRLNVLIVFALTSPKQTYGNRTVQAPVLGKNRLPGSLEQCHEMIRDLKAQLRAMELVDATELDKKEQTIEGISDMFALSALMPDKTRMYREFNEMKVKYQVS